jgi:hypothetical protein
MYSESLYSMLVIDLKTLLNATDIRQIAALYYRVDVCRLLIQYGLKPDLDRPHQSPLQSSLLGYSLAFQPDDFSTLRLFLLDCDLVDDFEDEYTTRGFLYSNVYSIDIIEWLWVNATTVLSEGELLRFRYLLLQNLVQNYHHCSPSDLSELEITEQIARFMNAKMMEHYLEGEFELLRHCFPQAWVPSSLDSQRIGGAFIALLKRLGLDFEACINMELERLPGDFLSAHMPWYMHRKVVFEPLADRGWLLKWIWVFDPSEPGHLLVSEHIGLGPDTLDSSEWPFSGFSWKKGNANEIDKSNTRFNRRMAIKARKCARTGQKRTKSRMPGAWDW